MPSSLKLSGDSKGWILIGVILLLLTLTIFAGRFFRSENKLMISFQNKQTISALLTLYNEEDIITNSAVMFFNTATNRFSGVYMLPATYISFMKNGKSSFLTLENALKTGISKEEIRNSISRLLGTKINYHIFIKESDFIKYLDIIGGINVFTEEISIPDENIYYPSGVIRLDGDKALEFLNILVPGENEHERLKRAENLTKNLLVLQNDFISSPAEKITTDYIYPLLSTNLSINDLLIFYRELAKRFKSDYKDFSRYFLGSILYCDKDIKDNQTIYLPKQSGNWIRSQVKDNLQRLEKNESIDKGNHITVELLNGTDIVGFANRTKHYLESFGFDVIEIGNADHQDYQHTVVLISNSEVKALKLAELIRCSHIAKRDNISQSQIDVTVILGKDFDGKMVK